MSEAIYEVPFVVSAERGGERIDLEDDSERLRVVGSKVCIVSDCQVECSGSFSGEHDSVAILTLGCEGEADDCLLFDRNAELVRQDVLAPGFRAIAQEQGSASSTDTWAFVLVFSKQNDLPSTPTSSAK